MRMPAEEPCSRADMGPWRFLPISQTGTLKFGEAKVVPQTWNTTEQGSHLAPAHDD